MSLREIVQGTCRLKLSGKSTVKVHPSTKNPDIVWEDIGDEQTFEAVTPVDPDTPKSEGYTRFVCISDTHSLIHRIPSIPEGDVLLHAGDFTKFGDPKEVRDFNEFLGTLPHRHKVVIAGNHDMTFDHKLMTGKKSAAFRNPFLGIGDLKKNEWKTVKSLLSNCIYLEDSEVQVMGFRIYGSPWQPVFCGWGFNLPRGHALLEKWNKIPEGIDILLTHGPPLGRGDFAKNGRRAGCVELLATVQCRVKPKYHVFGHIHEGYGVTSDGHTTFVNAAVCDVLYRPLNKPIVFDIPTPTSPAKK